MKRNLMVRLVLSALIVAAVLICPAWADLSDTNTWILNQSNTFADGIEYGSVKVTTNATSGLVQFHVEVFDNPAYAASGANFGIQSFGFNYTGVADSSLWQNVMLPTGWTQNGAGTMDGFGWFLTTEDGTGSSRVSPLDFSFVLPDPSQAQLENFAVLSTGAGEQGPVFFAAHVAGFAPATGLDGATYESNYIGSGIVPAPGAIILGILGLGLIGWIKRRYA